YASVGDPWGADDRAGGGILERVAADGDGGQRMVRAVAGAGGGAGGFAFFGGRLEQHWVHRGGSEESEAGRGAFDGVWDSHRDHVVLPGEPGVFVLAAAGADSECTGRPGGDGSAFGGVWSEGRMDDGDCHHNFDVWVQQRADPGGFASGVCDGQGWTVFPGDGEAEYARRSGRGAGVSGNLDCGFDFAADAQARR